MVSESTKLVCTGCSCLCDDIEIKTEENSITRVENACAKGASLLFAANSNRRAPFLVNGNKVTFQEAIAHASHLLQKARRVLLFGFDNCTLEAQVAGINLAQVLGGVIDDVSSFCHGALIEMILKGDIPTCSFKETKEADLLIYWGCNPYHSHPRHLSKFSYYAREKYDEAGWQPKVTAACVEIRNTETSSLCYPNFKVEPGSDRDFIKNVLATARGKNGTKDSQAFAKLLETSQFCVIFVGLGLIYALDNDFILFREMLHEFQKKVRFAVIPMVGHFNTLGFCHLLHERTGYINSVSFAKDIAHGEDFSFLEQVRNRVPDCVVIAGSDPFSNQPRSLIKNLEGVPIISLDPFITPTTKAAQVVFGTAISGFEVAGKAIRMDGTLVTLSPGRASGVPSDEEVLKQLLDEIGYE